VFRQASFVRGEGVPGDRGWPGRRSTVDLLHLRKEHPHELGFVEQRQHAEFLRKRLGFFASIAAVSRKQGSFILFYRIVSPLCVLHRFSFRGVCALTRSGRFTCLARTFLFARPATGTWDQSVKL
ncbi:unnamed protein product, partial [Pylaiella littoralis]